MAGEGKFALDIESVYVRLDDRVIPLREFLDGMGGDAPAWGDVTGKPSTFPPAGHTHDTGDITGLADALDGKQDTGDYATASTVEGVASRVTALEDADTVTRAEFTQLADRVTALEPEA